MARLFGTWRLPPERGGANPLRVPGVRIMRTAKGLVVKLTGDTTAVPFGLPSWNVAMKNGCLKHGTTLPFLDDAFAYMVYGLPGDPQLYAIEQSLWAAFMAGTDVLPLAWVDAHDA